MAYLILGLFVFLCLHSIRIVADGWRTRTIQRRGLLPWKRAYSALSFASLALIIWGYGQARLQPGYLWVAPAWGPAATALLMLVSMVLLMGFHFKTSHISVAVHHPMLWSVVVLGGAHLISNGTLHDLLLFGGFGVWALADLVSCYRRDRQQGTVYPAPKWSATLINLASGVLLWWVFARYLHLWLIGVSPMAH